MVVNVKPMFYALLLCLLVIWVCVWRGWFGANARYGAVATVGIVAYASVVVAVSEALFYLKTRQDRVTAEESKRTVSLASSKAA